MSTLYNGRNSAYTICEISKPIIKLGSDYLIFSFSESFLPTFLVKHLINESGIMINKGTLDEKYDFVSSNNFNDIVSGSDLPLLCW